MSDIDAGFGQAVPPPPRPVGYTDADTGGWWISVLGGLAGVAVMVWPNVTQLRRLAAA